MLGQLYPIPYAPQPSLSDNFLAGVMPSRYTHTRASAQTYFDSTGTLQSATTNVAAFDYNPTTLAPLGLSLWEARTNSIRNNTMVGASAPSTPPTNWVVTAATATLTYSAVGTENGITYLEVRMQDAVPGSVFFQTDSSTQIVAADTQTWTSSFYQKLSAGSLTNVTNVINRIVFRTAAGTFVTAQNIATVPTSAALNTQRALNTFTAANATIARVTSTVQIDYSGSIDLTLRIGLPQLELGAFATPVIQTSGADATRAAPSCSTTSLAWYNATEGTFVAVSALGSTFAQVEAAFDLNDGSTNNRTVVRMNTTGASIQLTLRSGAATVAAITSTISPSLSQRKLALAYKLDDFSQSVNGETPVTDTLGAVPVGLTTLTVGYASGPGEYINGWISSVSYYPTRLPNATLQALST